VDGGLLLEKSGLEVDVVFAMVEDVGVIFLGGRGRGALGSSALLRGTETSGGGVEIGLSGGGLPPSFLGAGQSGSSGCLGCACFLCSEVRGVCSISVGSSLGGGSGFGSVIVARRRHGARPGGRAECSAGGQRRGALGAAPVRWGARTAAPAAEGENLVS
jgi:hypothetical protein